MDWLILRDVLNTACNITSGTYKGEGGWVNDAARYSQPSCIDIEPDRWPHSLTIPQGEQMLSGTVWHHRPPY